jgi:hypothetical protein
VEIRHRRRLPARDLARGPRRLLPAQRRPGKPGGRAVRPSVRSC